MDTVRIVRSAILIQFDFNLRLINLLTNHKILTWSKWNSALYYVNTATPMLEIEGLPSPKLFIEDGFHLNLTGYDLGTKIVRDRIALTFYL